MTEEQMEAIAEKSAERAVKRFAADLLGIDVDNPESVARLRDDLRFNTTLRKMADRGLMSMAWLLGAGILLAMWAGIKSYFHVRS